MPTKEVTLEPGESKEAVFSFTPVEAKVYSVSIDGLSGSFEAISPPPTTHIIHLYEGWNAIGYDGRTQDIAGAGIEGLEMVYYWDNVTKEYLYYWPGEPSDFYTFEYYKAYWISVSVEQDWEVPNP